MLTQQGCGFQLRSAPAWPLSLQPVATESVPQGRDFVQQLRATFREYGVQLDGPSMSRVLVQNEHYKRSVQSLDLEGRVSEYRLDYQVSIGLNDEAGQPLITVENYHYQRSYAYDPTRALGHQWQLQEMIERMRQQAVEEFMQRVALSDWMGGK